ncbi:MAG TPA: putative quinol monooxygenase [Ilumatobacter sp.]|nr:putative quinol monooxygenase [Ilumatobacter sp.]
MTQIGATVRIIAKEGKAEELAELLGRLHAEVSAEPGCDLYSVVRSDRDTNAFSLIELYRDRDALKAHQRNEQLGPIAAGMPDLVETMDFQIGAVVCGDQGRRQ